MGAKWVLLWEPYAGTRVNHIFDIICRYIESIFSRLERGFWESSLSHLEPIRHDESQAALYSTHLISVSLGEEPIRHDESQTALYSTHLISVSLGEEPNKHYILRPNERRILELDAREELQFTTLRTLQEFTFMGNQFQLDGGMLQVGRVIANRTGALRGVLIEMDYYGNFSIEGTRNFVEEDFNMFNQAATERHWPGQFVLIECRYADFGLPDDYYTSKHTVLQYYEVITHLAAAFPGRHPGYYRRVRQYYAAMARLVAEFHNRCDLPIP